jgi:hypothetical protein
LHTSAIPSLDEIKVEFLKHIVYDKLLLKKTPFAFYVMFCDSVIQRMTASVGWWSEFLSANPEVPGSIPGATRFSE